MPPLPLPETARPLSPLAVARKARWALRIAQLALITLCAVSSTPRLAVAAPGDRTPSAEEQARFAEGLRLLQSGDARGAERAFKAGYAFAHDPAFLVRIGEAEERAGAPREAAESYAQYLRESPAASDRQDIEQRIQKLAPPGVPAETPGPTDAETPRSLPSAVAPVSDPGRPASPVVPPTSAAATGGDSTPSPAAASGAPSPVPRAPAPATRVQATDDEQLRALVDENAPRRSHLNTAAWISAGVTVLLLGTASFYGAKAGEKNGDVNRLLGNVDEKTGTPVEYASVASAYEAEVRDGRHDDRMAKGFAIAAGVAAATSVVLFIVDAVRTVDPPAENSGPRNAPVARRRAPASLATSGWGLGWSF